MRICKAVIILFLCCFINSYSQTNKNDIEKELVNIAQNMLDAVPTGNAALWDKYLLDNCLIITEEGKSNTKKEFLASIQPMPKGFSGHMEITDATESIYSNTAVLNFIAKEFETVFGQAINTAYRVSITFVKTDSTWKILSMQNFEIPKQPEPVKVEPAMLQQYAGDYLLTDGIAYKVIFENDKLYCQRGNRPKEELFAENENTFFTLNDTRGVKIFKKDSAGKVTQMIARRNGTDIIWKRTQP